MLKVEHLSKSFGKKNILNDINLEIGNGEIVSIIGPSGTGKTTLLRCINYLEKPDGGKITIDDVSVDTKAATAKDIHHLVLKSWMVFQSYNLFSNKTVIENVVEANLKACLAPNEASGEAFNIAYGGREYLIDIYYSLTKALNVDIEPIFGPDRKGDIKHSNADISKAKQLLNYNPEYDFSKGLNEAIEWYKENL